ncbi:quinoprotein relay system zinc metallohydrolase 2 [Glaciimonas sp. PCH181]|uniref:quinoprotein relay system zinc metallohydrolase 2 n=1 Tax=Glaciimonas sp. PCH181 TaxID=2133943 RepID=UPI000D3448EF|nr:quinoprotein relay system zinc metallohydrolase 2 [Glaciimonas sp. PCH181]PUA20290.1 quinoprotein relay system zinc metallohydrolase 2 [Glaciimonas sp. PCH181]
MHSPLSSRLIKTLLVIGTCISLNAQAEPLPVIQVANGVYVHQGVHEDFNENYHGDIANIGFVIGTDAVAVIDTGGSYKIGSSLKEAIRLISKLPIRYVINTHVHPDHIFGNAAFTNEHPTFIGHEKLPETMALRQDAYLRNLKSELGLAAENSAVIAPTITVSIGKNLEIDLGKRVLQLKAWPTAHTNTDLTVVDVSTKTLWTGDLLFVERAPSIDGDIKGWLSAIAGLKNMPADLAIPGHGPVTKNKNTALDNERRYLDLLLRDVRASIKNGEDMTKAMGTAAQDEKSHWVLFDAVNRRNVNLIYPVLEWE